MITLMHDSMCAADGTSCTYTDNLYTSICKQVPICFVENKYRIGTILHMQFVSHNV